MRAGVAQLQAGAGQIGPGAGLGRDGRAAAMKTGPASYKALGFQAGFSFLFLSSFLFLKQTNKGLNSNTNLNSNHTPKFKTMHQHECNTKNYPYDKF